MMLSQIGPGTDVFSTDIFSSLIPAILVGGAIYLLASLTQGRASFRTEATRDESASAEVENPVFETLYALTLAVLVAAFVGFGIEAVYPAPESPEDAALAEQAPPTSSIGENGPSTEPPGSPDEAQFQSQVGAYQQELANHDRIASVIAIVVAVAILIAGLITHVSRLPVIGDGVTLGGVLTLFYGMILAIQTPSDLLGFLVVTIALLALLATLYLKFRPGSRTTGS
jgi:hypothetical protein